MYRRSCAVQLVNRQSSNVIKTLVKNHISELVPVFKIDTKWDETFNWFKFSKLLRPRLHGTGSARLLYQIEYFQDECGF